VATPLLGQASIVIDQDTLGPGMPGVSRDDGVLSEVVTARNADNTSVTRHQWVLLKPRGSSATLSDPSAAAVQFTPDVDGTYTLILLVNEGRGANQRQRRLLGVRSTGGYRYPAQGESNEANWPSTFTLQPNETGWWEDMDAILRANQAFPDASLLTVDAEGALGNSRQLVAGAGISILDGGPGATLEISTSIVTGVEAHLDVPAQAENLIGVRTFNGATRDASKYGQVNLGTEVLGGKGTTANYATIGGGLDNLASAANSTVAGGTTNTASGASSCVGGGTTNTASVIGATVAGGSTNASSGGYASIGGGLSNAASGAISTIAGGNNNTASGDNTFIGGGMDNVAADDNSVVCGGSTNNIGADHSFIGSGLNNDIPSSSFAAIVGGQDNDISGNYASIGGGLSNQCNAPYSAVGGGAYNIADGSYNTIAGGYGNNTTADYGAICGGLNNIAGLAGCVLGGFNNVASGTYSSIVGGASNTASGDYSLASGRSSTASAENAIALGYNANATHAGSVVIKDGDSTSLSSSVANELTLQGKGGVRLYFTGTKFRRSGFSSSSNNDDLYHGSATTTGALLTSTTICAIPTNQCVHVRGILTGKRSSSADYAHRIYEGAFINNGGVVTTVTALTSSFAFNGGGNLYAATIGVSGTDIAVNYQGVAATTIRWAWKIEVFTGGAL